MKPNGFTLLEVLLALLVISVLIPVIAGGLGAVLRFSTRFNERTEAIALFETFLFESAENAGFEEKVPRGYCYSLEEDTSSAHSGYERFKASLKWREGKEALECAVFLPEKS